ncbi:hypothetical protein [Streptomyces lavendulae]
MSGVVGMGAFEVLSDEEFLCAAEFAAQEVKKKVPGAQIEIGKASTQIVAGVNYTIQVTAISGEGKTSHFEVTVYVPGSWLENQEMNVTDLRQVSKEAL